MNASLGEHLPEAADGRYRADAIADMVELHSEDIARRVASKKRSAGAKNLDRLGFGNNIVDLLREPRVMIGIAITKERPPLPAEPGLIIMVTRVGPAAFLVMQEPSVRGIDAQQSPASRLQAVVQIVIG